MAISTELTDPLQRANAEAVERFYSSRLADPEERLATWNEDGLKELAFTPVGVGYIGNRGRDELRAGTYVNARRFQNCVHKDLVIYPTTDASLFFVTSRFDETTTMHGHPYPQDNIYMIRIRDGKVSYLREYFNSERMADAFAATTEAEAALRKELAAEGIVTNSRAGQRLELERQEPIERKAAETETDRLREANRAVIDSFFSCDIDDPEQRLSLWAEDGVKRLPFAPKARAPIVNRGIEELRVGAIANARRFENCIHRDLLVYEGLDPEIFFTTSRMDEAATLNGEPYPQTFINMFRVRGGKVIEQYEYNNSDLLARLFVATRRREAELGQQRPGELAAAEALAGTREPR